MSKSLQHSFDIELATKYGLEEAILIHHFQHWIYVNQRQKKNFREGRTWTYQTLDHIAAHFPYWSKDQIVTLLDKLCDGKTRFQKEKQFEPILIKGNFNKHAYDRTVWYAFVNEEIFTILWKHKMENGDPQNGDCGNTTPIPDPKETIPEEQILKKNDIVNEEAKSKPPSPPNSSFSSSDCSFSSFSSKEFDVETYRLRSGELLSPRMKNSLKKYLQDQASSEKLFRNLRYYESQADKGVRIKKSHEKYLQDCLNKDYAGEIEVIYQNEIYARMVEAENKNVYMRILKTVVQIFKNSNEPPISIKKNLPPNTFADILDNFVKIQTGEQ